MKSHHDWIRRSQRVIRMVGELHRLGYQRLRIMPYEYPLAYRVAVAPVSAFSPTNGALIIDHDAPLATYTAASGNHYFDWRDAEADDARRLAHKFVERFPDVATSGEGRDWAYVGWLVELIGLLERVPDRLPVLMSEFGPDPQRLRHLPLTCYGDGGHGHGMAPLPPPGEASHSAQSGWQLLAGLVDDTSQLNFANVAKQIGLCVAAGIAIASAPRGFDAMNDDESWMPLVTQALEWFRGGERLLGSVYPDEATLRLEFGDRLSIGEWYPPERQAEASLTELVQMALESVAYATRHLCTNLAPGLEADWEGRDLPRFVSLHGYATSVFAGTAATVYPLRTLIEFTRVS